MVESDPKEFKQLIIQGLWVFYCLIDSSFIAFPFNIRFKLKLNFQRNSEDNLWYADKQYLRKSE